MYSAGRPTIIMAMATATTTTLIVVFAISIANAAWALNDTNQPAIQLVSIDRATSVLDTVNDTITFVDVQIAIAEHARLDVVDAVARLSSARLALKKARLAFDGGDYVGAVDIASQAGTTAQHALVLVPQPPVQTVQTSGMTFQQAKSMLESANSTILFVDENIAEAETARKNVITPVEKLAEARGLFRQASSAFNEGSYQSSHKFSSEAMALAQESLAVLSQAPPPPSFINPKNTAIIVGALLLIFLVVYVRIKSGTLSSSSTRHYAPAQVTWPRYYYQYPSQPAPPPPPSKYQYQPAGGKQYVQAAPVTTPATPVTAATAWTQQQQQQSQAKKAIQGQARGQ